MDYCGTARRGYFTTLSIQDLILICTLFQNAYCYYIGPSQLSESEINRYYQELLNDLSQNQDAMQSQTTEFFGDNNEHIGRHDYMSKRNALPSSFKGDPEFPVFEDHMTIPVSFPLDLQLFMTLEVSFSKRFYAVSLAADVVDPLAKDSIEMALHEYDGSNFHWIKTDSVFVKTGARMEIRNIDGYFYVFLLSGGLEGEQQIIIYLLFNSKFFSAQTLTMSNIQQFAIWGEPSNNNVFLGIVSETRDAQLPSSLYIYQWTDNHFILYDVIPMMSVITMESFLVDSFLFLAVCHHSDETGAENYATLFKFIERTKSFNVHQKILISDCSNIEYFEFKADNDDLSSEHFLIFATSDEHWQNVAEGSGTASSLIYKFFNGYFYPFQNIPLNDVSKWLACDGCADCSLLFVVTKYSGVHLYYYDGWTFSETSSFLESSVINHASLSMVDDSSLLLVVADAQNDGTRTNVFRLSSDETNNSEQIENLFDEWYSDFKSQLKKISQLDRLKKRIQSAPKADSTEVIINGALEFSSFNSNATLNLKLQQSSDSDRKEDAFSKDLRSKIIEISILGSFVDKLISSNGKFVINGDLFLNEFSADCSEECDLNILSISNLNGEDFDKLVANTVNTEISNSFDGTLDFENIAVSLHLFPKHINQHLVSSLVHKKRDILFQNGLKLNSVVVSKRLNVGGLIDEVKISTESVVMTSSSQTLNGSLVFQKGKIAHLNLKKALLKDQEMCFSQEDVQF